MQSLDLPRIVLVTRPTPLEHLLDRWGTMGQVKFYLQSLGQTIDRHQRQQDRFEEALAQIDSALPSQQRRVRVDRSQLDRFLFAPDDIIVIVGQDGLVPNTAKYLNGQTVIGINPDPENYAGVLCPHPPQAARRLIQWTRQPDSKSFYLQRRVMAEALREDGQRLRALNELFIGHRTHQSARYLLQLDERRQRQSSSGLICSTGTGSTGWACSIALQRGIEDLPQPEQQRLAWFVREPFPSVSTQADWDFGYLALNEQLRVLSEMEEGGVIFADGMESDWLEFLDGQRVDLHIAEQALHLLMPAAGTE